MHNMSTLEGLGRPHGSFKTCICVLTNTYLYDIILVNIAHYDLDETYIIYLLSSLSRVILK